MYDNNERRDEGLVSCRKSFELLGSVSCLVLMLPMFEVQEEQWRGEK